jgi:hypothetical protein
MIRQMTQRYAGNIVAFDPQENVSLKWTKLSTNDIITMVFVRTPFPLVWAFHEIVSLIVLKSAVQSLT